MNRKTQIYAAVLTFVVVGAVFTIVVVQMLIHQDAMPAIRPNGSLNHLDDVAGPPEFMAKWKTWRNLPESKRLEWLAEPEFNYMEDYLKLVEVSDDGISTADFENWVFNGRHDVDKEKRVPISENEINRLRTDTVMFDCRPYILNDELKAAIQNASDLTWLRLSEEFNEEDLAWLTDLERLKGLSLKGIAFENADLRSLSRLAILKWLELDCHAGNQLVLPSLVGLEVLSMNGRGITDQQLPFPDQFPKLKSLSVDSSEVTDSGVAQIARNCPRLKDLNLGWCDRISYKSVASLAQLKDLRLLYVNHTPLEFEASGSKYQTIPELQIKLPNCHIRIGER